MKAAADRTWTILDVLRWTTGYFKERGIDPPRATAEILLAHALGASRLDLYLNYDKPLRPDERARFRELVRRRAKGEPCQYLTGRQEFWSLSFSVNPDVLIPRPETELLVEEALKRFSETPPSRVLEIGTGCGAIVAALAKEFASARFVATDLSPAALALARKNARDLGLEDRIAFMASDLFDALRAGARFQLIVSNPPYVSEREFALLPRHIRDFEPRRALVGGRTGLEVIERIIRAAPAYLHAGGWLLLEIGSTHKDAVLGIAEQTGQYRDASVREDYARLPRILAGQKR